MSFAPVQSPRLRLVFDPEDHIDHHRALKAVHDLSAGRIVCELKGGRQNVTALAASVLTALGKDLDRRGNHKGSVLNWRRAEVWLRAEGVRELVAIRAQSLDWRCIEHMANLAARVDCGLTLVFAGQSELEGPRLRSVSRFPFEVLDFARWATGHGAACAKKPARPDGDGHGHGDGDGDGDGDEKAFPPVPADDFTLFRASCRDHLNAGDFATVDSCWWAAFAAARAWVSAAGALDEEVVSAYLRDRMTSVASYGEVLTTIRATQAALFHAGWLVKVNHERFTGSALQEPYGLLTAANAAALRGFVPPRLAAAATLAMVLRTPTELLTGLHLQDLDEDGAAVRALNGEFEIPGPFRSFLRALWLERVGQGAHAESPLFLAPDGKKRNEDAPMTPAAMRRTLKLVTRETGLLVVREFSSLKLNPSAQNWNQRYGVSVAKFGEADVTMAEERAA